MYVCECGVWFVYGVRSVSGPEQFPGSYVCVCVCVCGLQALSNISTAASKEFSLRQALDKMKTEWADRSFHCVPYKDSGTCVIGQTDEIQVWLAFMQSLLKCVGLDCLAWRCEAVSMAVARSLLCGR